MDYTTQMDAARKGIVTPQMKIVAEKEKMPIFMGKYGIFFKFNCKNPID